MPSTLKTMRVYLDAQRRGMIACVQCGTHTPMKISPRSLARSGLAERVKPWGRSRSHRSRLEDSVF